MRLNVIQVGRVRVVNGPFYDFISTKNANPAGLRVEKQNNDEIIEGNRKSIVS